MEVSGSIVKTKGTSKGSGQEEPCMTESQNIEWKEFWRDEYLKF
jgi:hypothetical protein